MIYCLKAQLLKDSMELNLLFWPDPKWTFSWAQQTREMLQESNFPFYEALPLEWRSLFKHIAPPSDCECDAETSYNAAQMAVA